MAIITVNGLTKHYGDVRALNGISFEVEQGEIIGLLGPNGAGKTTTMKILTGFLQPTEGTAMVGGFDVVREPMMAQNILGYLPENAPLYLDMVVQEYLQLIAELRQIPDAERNRLLSAAIYATSIEDKLTQPIGNLSKGFRQRVCLAQAILHKPKVLILDEPTNGLDPTQILEIRSLIERLSEHATVMVSTHILSEVEATCHRAIIIMDGEVRADAKLADLTATNAAVVAVSSEVSDVETKLGALNGIETVRREDGKANGYVRYHVNAEQDLHLCPTIYDAARQNDWRLAELRNSTRTLESVFNELTDQRGIS